MNLIYKYKDILKELFLYGIIGFVSAFSDAISFSFFIKIGIPLLFSNFISTNLGITISFILNTFFNFKKTNKLLKRALSFYLVGYFGLILSTVTLFVFSKKIGFDEMFVKIISIFVVAIVQYILNKILTYRGDECYEEKQ